jgi:hypothetical protein
VTDREPLPILVRQNDGRLEPLEPDRISHALFAATESLGTPDAFLARELADAIIPVLGAETQSPTTIPELADAVAKFVREVGYPDIARCYREQSRGQTSLPRKPDSATDWPLRLRQVLDLNSQPHQIRARLADPTLRELALSDVFPRDIISMVRDGLMVVHGLGHPFELAASVLGEALDPSIKDLGLAAALSQAGRHTGGFVVMDGPEHALAAIEGEPRKLAIDLLNKWCDGLQAVGLAGEIHLNHPIAPAWASNPQMGPLFGGLGPTVDSRRASEIAFEIALAAGNSVSVGWHLSRADVADQPSPELRRIIEFAVGGRPIEFVFDRSRQPISLGAGLTRSHTAALLFVGVHLPRLAEQVSALSPERFLQKLGSLARLARSAGHAKFDFLRRHGRAEATRGFRLERARLVVVPIGLEEAVRMVANHPACDEGQGTEFARAIVEHLAHALTREPPRNIEAILDSLPIALGLPVFEKIARRDIAGLTAWDDLAPPRQQVRACGIAQSVSHSGTAAIQVPKSSIEEIVSILRLAMQNDVQRLRLITS